MSYSIYLTQMTDLSEFVNSLNIQFRAAEMQILFQTICMINYLMLCVFWTEAGNAGLWT